MSHEPTNAPGPASHGNLEVFQKGISRYQMPIDRFVVVGRQRTGDPDPIARVQRAEGDRLIISPRSDSRVSREHVRIEPAAEGGYQITNTSRNCSVGIDTSRELLPNKSCLVGGLTRLQIHDWVIVIDDLDWKGRLLSMGTPEHRSVSSESSDGSLVTHPDAIAGSRFETSLVATLGSSFDAQQRAYLMRWLRVIAELFRHAGDRQRFLQQANLAIRQILGADDVVATFDDALENDPKQSDFLNSAIPAELLQRVRACGQTTLYRVDASDQIPGRQILATPLFDRAGRIEGILAASRTAQKKGCESLPPYGELEKSLLELIAGGFQGG